MEHEKAEVEIEGTVFVVDAIKGRIAEKADRDNTIQVFDMQVLEDGYGFWYNRAEKNIRFSTTVTERDTFVRLKWLVDYDPEGMAQRSGKPISEVVGKSDYDLLVDQDVLQQRLDGAKVSLDVMGRTFHADFQHECFMPADGKWEDRLPFGQDIKYYECYQVPFDPLLRQFVRLDEKDLTSIPDHLIAVEFSPEWQIDPIGYLGLSKDTISAEFKYKYLMMRPPKLHHEAKVIPWHETKYPSLIAENKKQEHKRSNNRKRGLR